jgi:hypothetical protein
VDDPGVTTEPAAVDQPVPAVDGPTPLATTHQCVSCGAPLAHDQRYCLQCGEPRPHVAVTAPTKPAGEGSWQAPPAPFAPPPGPGVAPTVAGGGQAGGGIPIPGSIPPGIPGAHTRSNSLALIAGVGVLLLAMGIGVLIGRAGAGSAKTPPAQVISLGGATGTGTPAATTPTATTPATPAPTTKGKKEAKAKASAGAGSSIDKPAPPSAAQNLRSGGSGQSYEQRSKNLPNVVSTG